MQRIAQHNLGPFSGSNSSICAYEGTEYSSTYAKYTYVLKRQRLSSQNNYDISWKGFELWTKSPGRCANQFHYEQFTPIKCYIFPQKNLQKEPTKYVFLSLLSHSKHTRKAYFTTETLPDQNPPSLGQLFDLN